MRSWLLRAVVLAGVASLAWGCQTAGDDFESQTANLDHVVTIDGNVIHRTNALVTDVRLVTVPGTSIRIATWNETLQGATNPFFAIDPGQGFLPAKQTTYKVPLHTRAFDPMFEARSESLD